jgi:hypothetical protein
MRRDISQPQYRLEVTARRGAIVAQALLACFLTVLVFEHLLQPGLSPIRHRISEYANTSSGWLFTSGFAAWALALLTTAAIVWLRGPGPRILTLALAVAFMLAAAGALISASFKTGTSAGVVVRGHVLTSANTLHDVGTDLLELAL